MIALSNVPIVVLFGPTNSEKFAPNYKDSIILDSKRMYKKHKEWGTDMSYENNGGIVVDDTGECESCQ